MKRSKELLIKKIWVLLIITFMMMTSFLSANTISADDPGIKTSADLQAAIDKAEAGATIVLDSDIAMEGTVTIKKKITIKGKEGGSYTLFQKQRDEGKKYQTMFVVEEYGDLTLGENLVLTGKNGKCQSAKVTPYVDEDNIINPAKHELWEFEQATEPSEQDANGWLGFKRNQAGTTYTENVAIVDSKETASTAEYGGSYIWIENGYIYCKKPGESQKQLGANGRQVQFYDDPSVPIKVGENGELTAAFSSSITWYVHSDSDEDTLYADSTSPGIYAFGSKPVGFANSAPASGKQWVIGEQTFKKPDQENEAKAALEEYNNARYTYNEVDYTSEDDARTAATLYWQVEGDSTEYPDEDSARAAAEGAGPCSVGTCTTYSTSNFEGGSIESPKGFFIQIDGGTATLDGAIMERFYTDSTKDNTLRFVAPVVANGGAFNIRSGRIQNNVVGYIAIDSNSGEDANAIKMYVKGAAPNAPRKGKLATTENRRRKPAGIDAGDAGSGITGTAGAVIYTNGASGSISGGNISYNRGDTGGIMVSGDANVTIEGADVSIDHNVGVQFGGGSFVEDGGSLTMTAGTMSQNVAWFGGGAVYATENGIAWLLGKQNDYSERKDGNFKLDGGILTDNTAFTRGGAILVDSDGVILKSGTLSYNKSRMLGGAVYVMGDDPRYTYTLYIEKGYVYNNRAVSATLESGTAATSRDRDDNMSLSKILNTPCGCDYNEDYSEYNLFSGYMGKNSDDLVDGKGTDGTGGGVWLCAYGSSNINLDNEQFVINHNYASGSAANNQNGQPIAEILEEHEYASNKTGGNDLHKDTKATGSVRFSGLAGSEEHWYNENTGDLLTNEADYHSDGVYESYGLRNLINTSNVLPKGYGTSDWNGVVITENVSRRGGGLAANGTYIFGTLEDIGNIYAEMSLEKLWSPRIEDENIAIEVSIETEDGQTYPIDVIVPLKAQASENESELDTVFVEDNYKSRFVVPVSIEVEEEGKTKIIQVFDVTIDGEPPYDLTSYKDLVDLAKAIEQGKTVKLDTSKVKFVFKEGIIDDQGNFAPIKEPKYSFSSEGVVLDKVTLNKEQIGDSNKHIYQSNIYLKNKVINDVGPEIEKYINQAVHKDINLDEIFTYDILAYVTMDADKVIIKDQLVDELEFASNEVTILDIGESNNHKVNNDVSGAATGNDGSVGIKEGDHIDVKGDEDAKATTISGAGVLVESDEGLLTVTLDNGVKVDETTGKISREFDTVTKLHGHWIKVTFQAKIKQDIQDKINSGEMKIKDLQNIKIKADEVYKDDSSIYPEGENRPEPNVGNDPVDSDENHNGIINTASYVIEVLNDAKYKDESNTVTVKPDIPEVEKYVNQAVHKDIELDEVFTYDIIGLINKTADKVTFKDQLVDDLEIVDINDIEVVYLDDNNHKPYNDISGNVVNPDASVAQKGTSIKDEKGVTVEVKDNCLTVTLDDGVDGRERELVKNLRGKYVKVTFKAQIKKELQNKIKAGEMKITDLKNVTINENGLVLSNEKHNGIDNKAMMVTVGNDSVIEQETNVVTVGPEVVTVVVKKIWDDGNNADKIRPDTVTIILLADGKEVDRVQIAYKDNWTYTFANLVKSKDGKKIDYTVDEVSVKGYKKTIDGYEITNTHIPDKPKRDYDIPKTGVK